MELGTQEGLNIVCFFKLRNVRVFAKGHKIDEARALQKLKPVHSNCDAR